MTPEERRREAENDLRELMSTATGRRVLWALVSGSEASTFAGEQTHTSAYQEGRRAVSSEWAQEIQRVAPADYVHMQAEALRRRAEDQTAQREEQADGGRDDPGKR